MFIQKGDAYAAMDNYAEAVKQYGSIFSENYTEYPELFLEAVANTSRITYKMGKYDDVIDMIGNLALKASRSFAGIHKYMALAQKGKGDIDAARRTMSRAILH